MAATQAKQDERGLVEEPTTPGPTSHHYLEWILGICLMACVWSKMEKMDINDPLREEIAVDNRNYHAAYGKNISPLEVRFVSVARQWSTPLLFWAWGAWLARRRPPLTPIIRNLLACAAAVIVVNSALWLLGPQDPKCDPCSKCPAAPSVFSFTVVPHNGKLYPYFYQACTPLVFVLYLGLSWPLISMLNKGSLNLGQVAFQWLIPSSVYAFITLVWHRSFPYMPLLLVELLLYELVFLVAAALTLSKQVTSWLPLRALHYLMAVAATFQFGCTPVGPAVQSFSLPFGLFIFAGTFKLFQLGYVMGFSRKMDRIFSQFWPLVLLVYVIVAPSTNWYKAGDVTFPYFPSMMDRALYVTGTVCLAFTLDRMGRLVETPPVPLWVNLPVLITFMSYPLIVTLLIAAGVDYPAYVDFYIVLVIAAVFGVPLGVVLDKRRSVEPWKEVEEGDAESSSSSE